MQKKTDWIILLLIGSFLVSGCTAALVGGAALGAGSGTYIYINREMKTDYYQSFDATWGACEKTMADMRGLDVRPAKEIGNGKIAAVINDENVEIAIIYKAKNVTTVSIRVGLMGNALSSQLIHDRISDNLVKK
jgi:hypothetical protein